MRTRARELETLLLTMFAAVPLYFTYTIGIGALVAFHAAMAGIVLRVAIGKSPELVPARLMRWLALAYLPLYLIDWRFLSGSALAASADLVLFIAVYQPIESMQRDNYAQRLLTTTLIFVASLATSTHIMVLPFVLAFGFLMLRQLMHVSHVETVRSLDRAYAELPSSRAASFYLAGAMGIGAALFPLLPRVRSPFLQGVSGPISGSSTALSESIDFTRPRVTSADAAVVSRVWMDTREKSLFTPVRLRGMLYDRYANGEFRQTYRGLRDVIPSANTFTVAHDAGVTGDVTVQQRPMRGRVFLPVGTTAFTGLTSRLYEGPAPDTFFTYQDGVLNLTARVATHPEPLALKRVTKPAYPISPQIEAMARRIVGSETRPERQAALIEQYLARNFRYVPNPATLGKTMSVDDFLLRDRVGHCEYFAAGMVVLMTALDVPSRIASGFYGGRYNPLGGYYAIRREDVHAWTEVWNGERWVTFDSTPPALRPGSESTSAIRDYVAGLADSMTFIWDRYVLTFSLGDQAAIAEDAIAKARSMASTMRARVRFVPLALLPVALIFALSRYRRRTIFDVLAAHLKSRGIDVGSAMTMEEALRALPPDAARELAPLIALYEEESFSPRRDRTRARQIRRKLAELRATS
ncbi:MAG TPA: transglutaminaseTgpA domain-containing protein [Thermoanaerobaculia bacterium]|nr:transglutaminaseTgpA domain-containing protein [Thermoanaerobaculia bacterium]